MVFMRGKMGEKTILFCLSVSFAIVLQSQILFGQETTEQITTGDQSPNIIASGDVTVTINDLENVLKILEEIVNINPKQKEYKLSELQRRIAIMRKETSDALPQEAEDWATYFITSLPIRKDNLLEEKEKKKEFNENLPYRLSAFVDYVFTDFDLKIKSLSRKIPGIKIEIMQDYDFLGKEINKIPENNPARKVVFPSGKSILLIFNKKGDTPYPKIEFFLLKKHLDQAELMFSIWGRRSRGATMTLGEPREIKDITYNINSESFISPEFKERYTKSLTRLIEFAYID